MDSLPVRRAVWEGRIPCRIELDPTECRVLDGADPYYLTLPRLSYLPLFIPQVYRFFQPFLIDLEVSKPENAWFEFEAVPLKWHWPIGLLYDLFTGRDPSSTTVAEDEDHCLPWNLTLHFQNYPTKHLIRMREPSACHDAWMHNVKEAAHVRDGSSKAVMNLSKDDSTRLWESIESYEFEKFWSIKDRLLSDPSGLPLRSIPIKLYIPGAPRVVQGLISPMKDSRDPHTVGTALNKLLPELFPSQRFAVLARPILHGVVVPMHTPLRELMQAAAYLDGFLHISLVMMS